MKKLLIGFIAIVGLAGSMPALAQHRHGQLHGPHFRNHVPNVVHHHRMQRHWHPHHGWIWVVPTIIGGALVYDIVRHQNQNQNPVVITEEIITPGSRITECSEWKEIQGPDGKVYRERSCVERPQ